jgi:hypothetical protein
MAKMTAAEAMVKILEDEGVEAIFGIPGAGILPFYAALKKSTKIKHILLVMKRVPRMQLTDTPGQLARSESASVHQDLQGLTW